MGLQVKESQGKVYKCNMNVYGSDGWSYFL